MSRAAGKHGPRSRGQLAEEGIGDPRDIPGGRNHLANPEVSRETVPVPETEWPYRRALLAHGVDPDEAGRTFRDPRLSGGQRGAPVLDAPVPPGESPVPVYIVERAGWPRPQAYVDARHLTVPAASGEPVMVCPANPARSLVQLLNEDSSHNVRFGRLEDLQYDAQNAVITGGARLPSGASGYTILRTQDALYAISETSSTVTISVVLESELRGGLS